MTMQALVRAGLYPGKALIGADPSNPDGHFEDIETVRLHDRWLAVAGTDWCHAGEPPAVDERDADAAIGEIVARLDREIRAISPDAADTDANAGRAWGIKDPRATLFLSHWMRVVPTLHVVLAYRHFASCLESLQRRQASELLRHPSPEDNDLRFWTRPATALESWLLHNRCALRVQADFPDRCAVVSQEALVRGAPLVRLVERRWGLGLNEDADSGVDADKARQARSIDLPDTAARAELQAVWERLQAVSEAPAEVVPEPCWRALDIDAPSDGHRPATDAIAALEPLEPLWDRLGVPPR